MAVCTQVTHVNLEHKSHERTTRAGIHKEISKSRSPNETKRFVAGRFALERESGLDVDVGSHLGKRDEW